MKDLYMKTLILLLISCSLVYMFSAQAKQVEEHKLSNFCYLPTQSNVSYAAVLELEKSQATHLIQYGLNPLQYGELWLPDSKDANYKHPLVIFVHGGCWLNEFDISHTHAFSTALANNGYAVWSIEYRRTGDQGGGWPGSYQDIEKAIDFVPNLRDYPIDLRKIALLGHSAGGHLALLAGSERRASLSAVIGLAAIYDIEQYSKGNNSCQTAASKFMGGDANAVPEQYRAANPSKQALHPNTILMHGSQDTIVPIQQTESTKHRVVEIEDAGHFDMIYPGTQTFQVLLKKLASIFK